MAIPTGTVFSSIPAAISEKKSSLNNGRTEGYTILAIKQAVSALQADDFHHETIGTEVIAIATDGIAAISHQDADLFTVNLTGADGVGNLSIPDADGRDGKVITLVGGPSLNASRTINVIPSGGSTISGAGGFTLNANFQVLRIVSNGTDWIKLN